MAAGLVTQGFIDFSGERSRTEYHVPLGVGDVVTPTTVSKADAVHDAMAAITLCNMTLQTVKVYANVDTPTPAVSEDGNREMDLVVQYVNDDNPVPGQYFRLHIPGPDLFLLAQANTDEVDIASNVTALALIAVLEADLTAPGSGGDAIRVQRMFIRGRRN